MGRADHSEWASDHQSLLARTLAGTDTGVWEWNIQTDRVEWSPPLERLVGLEPGTFEGTAEAHIEHLCPDDPAAFDAAIDAGDPVEFERQIVGEDGPDRWLLVRGALETADEPARVVGVALDVTAQKEREQALQEDVERLDQFASLVSHDLRNPLTVAKGSYELFSESGDPDDLSGMGDALDRIEAIATDMLALARHGSLGGDCESVSLGAVARLAWESIDTREATLVIDADGTVEANPSQLRTLFENLFKNAVGHGGNDVTVTVGRLPGGFYVEDTGPGIPADHREKVFEHGYTTGYGGTGTGLTIVQRIAAAHDWVVTLGESSSGGARFEFVGADGSLDDPSADG